MIEKTNTKQQRIQNLNKKLNKENKKKEKSKKKKNIT